MVLVQLVQLLVHVYRKCNIISIIYLCHDYNLKEGVTVIHLIQLSSSFSELNITSLDT